MSKTEKEKPCSGSGVHWIRERISQLSRGIARVQSLNHQYYIKYHVWKIWLNLLKKRFPSSLFTPWNISFHLSGLLGRLYAFRGLREEIYIKNPAILTKMNEVWAFFYFYFYVLLREKDKGREIWASRSWRIYLLCFLYIFFLYNSLASFITTIKSSNNLFCYSILALRNHISSVIF